MAIIEIDRHVLSRLIDARREFDKIFELMYDSEDRVVKRLDELRIIERECLKEIVVRVIDVERINKQNE